MKNIRALMKIIRLFAILCSTLFYSLLEASQFGYASNLIGNTVSVIDLEANEVINTIDVGQITRGIAVTSDGSKVFAGGIGYIHVIDTATNQKISEIFLGSAYSLYNVYYVTIDDKNKRFYALAQTSSRTYKIALWSSPLLNRTTC